MQQKLEKLPITYELDKDLLLLLSEANQKYGEYKSSLLNMGFDSKLFLDSILLTESLKSTQIEGIQITEDDMYYLKYMPKSDETKEIENLKDAINYIDTNLKDKDIDINMVNKIHKILLDSVRGNNKEPGKIRSVQNWIGAKGASIEDAIYVPPAPEEVSLLLENLFKYMNDSYIDPVFINVAISHTQFESIHPYRDGNGRVGRTLIPIQIARLTGDDIILYLSEVIELYKPSYYRYLNEYRNGNILGFIKFFLQCVIEQCNNYLYKINSIKRVYNNDLETIKVIKGNSIYRIMPIILKQVVFTKKEIEDLSGVSRNVVSNLIDKLVELNIIDTDTKYNKKGYIYKNIYNIFVGKE